MPQSLCGVADLALPGQEHQNVARRLGLELTDGVDDGLGLIAHLGAHDFVVRVVGVVVVVGCDRDFQWAVTDLDGKRAARDFDDGCSAEVRAKRSGSIVADVTMTLRSGRRGSISRR